MNRNQFFVVAIKGRKGIVLGYGVYDEVNGLRSEHERWMIGDHGATAETCLHLANMYRDDRNDGVK